jgi:23S rRNA (cytosine1962-C5)-methyltransferase
MQRSEGLSPGLFLDQGRQRRWVYELCREGEVQSILNLFAYTGGFSVAAALGGAKEVVSVDLSKKYLEWIKRNFALNNLTPEKFEFWSVDSQRFLEGSVRRNRKFDLVVCDPPSFSRSPDGVFQVEKAYSRLIELSLGSLNADGLMQFSCNYQKWTIVDFQLAMKEVANKNQKRVRFPKLANEFQGAPDASKIAIFE